jgi:hypothetical protein
LKNYSDNTSVKYRIAYIAICIKNNDVGMMLHNDLQGISQVDPKYIQFGSSNWFWKQYLNSYILQTEPERFKFQDTAIVDIAEALHLQTVKKYMFQEIRNICLRHIKVQGNNEGK